jgi:hypothetical protein
MALWNLIDEADNSAVKTEFELFEHILRLTQNYLISQIIWKYNYNFINKVSSLWTKHKLSYKTNCFKNSFIT